MTRPSICAQLFGFVALVAALFVLPQAAQAHAGHAHGMHVHTQAQSQTADVSVIADGVVEQRLSTASQDAPGQTGDAPCDRGCCAQGSCSACFSLVAPMPPLVQPPSLSATVVLAAYSRHSGIAGPSLRRPPKSFA